LHHLQTIHVTMENPTACFTIHSLRHAAASLNVSSKGPNRACGDESKDCGVF
jgi:hypothetical protein